MLDNFRVSCQRPDGGCVPAVVQSICDKQINGEEIYPFVMAINTGGPAAETNKQSNKQTQTDGYVVVVEHVIDHL